MGKVAVAIMVAAAALAGGAALAQGAAPFFYDPQPRWAEDPGTEVVCAAIARECVGLLKDGEIETNWGYAELYDPDGYLVGMRSTRSTGCKPLDEHLLLGQRHFRGAFRKAGTPDLDDITAELAPGASKSAVRIVKRGETQVSIGC
ncbi:MAG TPA: hypothetical protein VK485_08665 [Sphingomicrobium sp.]|nr:hypothetical protein [Sphingomicrobium sp.]